MKNIKDTMDILESMDDIVHPYNKKKSNYIIKPNFRIIKLYVIRYTDGSRVEFYDFYEYKNALNEEYENIVDNFSLSFYESFANEKEVIKIRRKHTCDFYHIGTHNGKKGDFRFFYRFNPELSYVNEEPIWDENYAPSLLADYYNILREHNILIYDDPYKFVDETLRSKKEKVVKKLISPFCLM